MYEILSIGTSGSGEGLLLKLSTPEGTETLSISSDGYRELRLSRGEISEAQYRGLKRIGGHEAALSKGLSILGYGANSKSQLVTKLTRGGISRSEASAVADELQRRGYLNEDEDACRIAEGLVRKFYGPKRVISALRSKGYSDSAIVSAVEWLDGVNTRENCLMAARKRIKNPPTSRAEAQKAIAKLIALGYNVNDAKYALAALISDRS